MLRVPEQAQVQHDVVIMAGGYDQVTSAYQLAPGALRDCVNFACRTQGGYYRIPGYERFDGRPEPHRAGFVPIDITLSAGHTIAVGDSGDFGNLTGVVSYVDPFGRYIGLTKTTDLSTPLVPGPIVIGFVTVGQANSYYSGGLSIRDLAINKAAAANIYRADIGVVPGSGPVRGVFYFQDTAYALRDNAAATACVMHRSSASGWVAVDLGHRVEFSSLTDAPADGATLTQGGVTATILRTAITSGDVTVDTAAGYFVIDTPVGGNFAAGVATFTGGTCTIGGAEVVNSLAPGGRYSFRKGALSAAPGAVRIYGADGVNDAFEFDGAVFVPIPLDATEKPRIVAPHADHLFFGIKGSLIHSALGDPYNFEVIKGAGEIACGGEITDMLVLPGNQGTAALGVFSEDSTWVLYGTSSADWRFVNFNLGVGAKRFSAQNLFEAFAFDARGMTMMRQSLNYGNFDAGRVSYNIRPFIHEQRARQLCSGISRENGQYRVFFDNGYGIYTTVRPDGIVGHGVVLFPDPALCYYDGESSTGDSVSLFGTADGYVMRNDVGSSFDGKNISAYLNTNINSAKSPRLRKRYRRLVLELQGEAHIDMRVGYSFDWATAGTLPHLFVDGSADLSGRANWDNMFWDAFFWDGRTNDVVSVELQGSGENLQMIVIVDSNFTDEFTLSSAVFHYTPRRGNR